MRFSLQFAKYLAIATVEKNIGQDVRALLRRLKEKPCFQFLNRWKDPSLNTIRRVYIRI